MSLFIHLENQYGLPWQKHGNFYFKGNCNFKIFEPTFENAFEFLQNSFGNFAWIYEDENKIIFSTDTIRSYPIFYFFDENHFSVADNAHFLKEKYNTKFNQNQIVFFEQTGYTSGEETLLENVFCPNAFSYFEFDKKTRKLNKNAFSFELGLGYNYFKDCEAKFEEVSTQLFANVIEKLDGKKAIIPLSAGLDSRFILAALVKNGFKNIVCFTYGKRNSYEVKVAYEITQKLDIEWHFVEYNEETFELYKTEFAWQYEMFASQYNTIAYEQDFFAIYQLKKQGKLPETGVFLPGYCGDLLAGSKTIEDTWGSPRTDKLLLKYVLEKQFPKKIKQQNVLESLIKSSIKKVETPGNPLGLEPFNSAYECWYYHHKSNKFINNGIRCFEYFGYDWIIPFSFYTYIHFWENLMLIERETDKVLYKKNLYKYYFTPLDIDFENDPSAKKWKSLSDFLKKATPEDLKRPLKKMFIKGSEYDVNNLLIFGKMLMKDVNLNDDFENENIAHARWLLKKLNS